MNFKDIPSVDIPNKYSCQSCETEIILEREVRVSWNEYPLCDKCLFKVFFKVFNEQPIKWLIRLANCLEVDYSDTSNKNNLVFKIIQKYKKLFLSSIKHTYSYSKVS